MPINGCCVTHIGHRIIVVIVSEILNLSIQYYSQ